MFISLLLEKFNFYFSAVLCQKKKILLWKDDWALGYKSMKFSDLPDLS